MKSYKGFIVVFFISFVAVSLPYMMGYGISIDFQKGVHPFWVLFVYIKEGLAYNFIEKSIISIVVSAVIHLYIRKRQKKSAHYN